MTADDNCDLAVSLTVNITGDLADRYASGEPDAEREVHALLCDRVNAGNYDEEFV